jgi:hypothetical protein
MCAPQWQINLTAITAIDTGSAIRLGMAIAVISPRTRFAHDTAASNRRAWFLRFDTKRDAEDVYARTSEIMTDAGLDIVPWPIMWGEVTLFSQVHSPGACTADQIVRCSTCGAVLGVWHKV